MPGSVTPPTPTLFRRLTMESLSFTRSPSPKSSGKRTSSPGARTPQAKRPKMELRQVHSNRDKRRRRKKKKQPMTRDLSELSRNECPSSLAPDPPLPSASSSTESRQRLVSPQLDFLLGRPSTPAPSVNSKPIGVPSSLNNSNRSPGSLASVRQERVIPTLHDEDKVRLPSIFVSNGVQIIYIVFPRPQSTPCVPYILPCVPDLSRLTSQTFCALPLWPCLLPQLSR